MVFNMQQARDGNTTSYCSSSIWRVFLNGKLFVSNNHKTCFDTKEDAEKALMCSDWMRNVQSYIDYSQQFFNKIGDKEWGDDFKNRVLKNMDIKYKEYKDE